MSDDGTPCRHGYHGGRCLAPACENAPHASPPRRAQNRHHGNVPIERLSEGEARQARALLIEHGVDKTARMLGLSDVRTVYRALAGDTIHRLTATTIRAALTRGSKDVIP